MKKASECLDDDSDGKHIYGFPKVTLCLNSMHSMRKMESVLHAQFSKSNLSQIEIAEKIERFKHALELYLG